MPPGAHPVDKADVLQQIIAALQTQLEGHKRAAQEAYAAATDPGSKAENKYDTRSLESSYLARGQALRVGETEEALASFRALSSTESTGASALGSLVTLETSYGTEHYFLGSAAGGTEVTSQGHEILVITPASPLGKQLMARRAGERFALQAGTQTHQVVVKQIR